MNNRVLKEYEETLSLRGLARGTSNPEPVPAPSKAAAAHRLRVFVIDDEEGVCKYVAAAVTELGCNVDYFTSAQLAVRALKHCPPEIIFLDIALGGSDAIDVLRTLEQLAYRGVIQVMSGSNQGILDDVRRIGERHKLIMRPPLQKPFRMDAIRKVISGAPIDLFLDKAFAPDAPPSVGLDEALQRNWLEVWYQPKLDFAVQKFVSAEGLIRCRHPKLGVLPPASFLPGAQTKSLTALTQFVILTALRDWEELLKRGHNLRFAINAPIASLTDLNLPILIRDNRPKSADWPGLIIEITEGEVARDVGLAHEIATQLSIYGINLSIDDFGEGSSSFARLRELSFSELKLDGSFVKNCAHDSKNAGICQAIIALAHQFGAVAVAEGLENAADIQAVQQMGCDLGQGFAIARPIPSALFTSVLSSNTR
jgi:EAL domain-containing protein (putative c-di-GMP-specific phosphodiesterase class I)/CheY-like chemotaxis protein